MKHVGKLAIICALLKAVKTSYGRTIQGRTCHVFDLMRVEHMVTETRISAHAQ